MTMLLHFQDCHITESSFIIRNSLAHTLFINLYFNLATIIIYDIFFIHSVVHCPPLDFISGLKDREFIDHSFPFGTQLELVCEEHMSFDNGMKFTRTECGLSKQHIGEWSPKPSDCKGIISDCILYVLLECN